MVVDHWIEGIIIYFEMIEYPEKEKKMISTLISDISVEEMVGLTPTSMRNSLCVTSHLECSSNLRQ